MNFNLSLYQILLYISTTILTAFIYNLSQNTALPGPLCTYTQPNTKQPAIYSIMLLPIYMIDSLNGITIAGTMNVGRIHKAGKRLVGCMGNPVRVSNG